MELARADLGLGPHGPDGLEGPNGPDAPYDPHALYARLGFIIVSAKMSAAKSKTGEWKKHFAFPRGWQNKDSADIGSYDKRVSGFALVTGLKSGVTAIDIDDPETAQYKRLMALMTNCTLVARTKKGYHYVYKYDARILQTTGDKLDTRNDGGCIFVAPSVAYDDERRAVAEYRWIRVPREDESLATVPESVIEFLRSLNSGYVSNGAPRATGAVTVAPAAPTAPAAPAAQPVAEGPCVMAQAMRAVQMRAGPENADRVGFPTRVVPLGDKQPVWGCPAARIEFSHQSGTTRVCPVTRILHDSNHFFVTIGVDEERTGLPAFLCTAMSITSAIRGIRPARRASP